MLLREMNNVLWSAKMMLMESPADIILQQLGGAGRVKAMTGARNFMARDGGKTLSFDFPNKMKGKPNFVQITLTGRDDYDIEFGRKSRGGYKKVKTYSGIYADQLIKLFENETGLYLRL